MSASVIEYIKTAMKEENVTQIELGNRIGLTRQSVFDMLSRANPNFVTVRRAFNALGREIDIRRKDGEPLEFDKNEFYELLTKEAPCYGKLNSLLDFLGYEFVFTKNE